MIFFNRHCKATKELLNSLNCKFKFIELDEMGKFIKIKNIIKYLIDINCYYI